MKQFILAIFLFSSLIVKAQSDKYVQAMETNINALSDAKTVAELQATSNNFLRIAEAEKTQWLPYYYAALAQAFIGYMDQSGDKDVLGNYGRSILEKAEAIEKNGETYAVRYMLANIQMMVDPMTRWQTYGMQATEALNSGKKLDPENPRIYYLQGVNLFYTPEQFGGGKVAAKPLLEKSVELYNAASPKPLYPKWGKPQAEKVLAECN